MFLPIALLLLLLNIPYSSASEDQFVFNVTFTCRHPQNYQYKIEFIESDWWIFNGDDSITKERTGVASPGDFNIFLVGLQNGDELTSEGYDVRMKLTHNCTKDHKDVKIYMYIYPHCEIGKGICHLKISRDITDVEGEIPNYANLIYLMTIKLLRFPYLVQMNIFKQLPYSELFLLSICSLRIQNLMRNLRLDGSSSFIKYRLMQRELVIEIGDKQNIDQMQHLVAFVIYGYIKGMGRQECKISDLNVNFGVTYLPDQGFFALIHPNLMDMVPAVQKHILSFFKTFVPSRLDFKIDELDGFPKIDGVEESTLRGENLEGTSLERFFNTYPNQTRCKIHSKNIKNLEEGSQLFDLDVLYVDDSTTMATMILKQFKGSHLYFFKTELKMEDVMQFFQRWKSGEAYQNLEYLYIGLKSGQFDHEMAITQLEAEPWDQTKRSMIFHRSPKILEWFASATLNKPLNCQHFLDIERDDGRLASIQIRSHFLRVCVWTDSQLEMDNNA